MVNPSSQKTVVSSSSYIELQRNGEPPRRYPLVGNEHRLGRDPRWADFVVPSDWNVVSSYHAILRREGEDYRIYDGDENKKPSTNGIFINKTRITCSKGYLLKGGELLEIGQDPSNYIKLIYINPNNNNTGQAKASKQELSLKDLQEWPVELGREPRQNYYSSIQLDSPVVSRIHATIFPAPQGGYLIKDCSTNGTFVNDQRLYQPVLLKDKDTIKIGPFTLTFRDNKLEVFDRGQQIRLDAHQLYRKVKDQKGKEKVILDRVSLPIEPGQLVALVGGSGAGKSTLLKTLLGIEPVTSGKVLLNDEELRENFHLYRTHIGYVPQDDIVHQDLTVEEVLIYACKLRLPPETNVEQALKRVISQVKLDSVKDNLVSKLSGGQRKRVSIAVELLADPHLFFLDEPTSGLDPGLDKEIMKLLRELANQGRTIVLVTHATANIEVCDQIVFMGRGGSLCYFGHPIDSLKFFNMPQDLKYFADIYLELDRGKTIDEVIKNVKEWANKFLNTSPLYQSYQQVINARSSNNNSRNSSQTSGFKKGYFLSLFQQLYWLSLRYIKLISREIRSLILALATAPISIFLITLTLKDKDPLIQLDRPELAQAPLALKVLFIFTCAALWVGLSGSVQEIIKELSIYARERLINLSLLSYLGSKILIRSILALIQTILVSIVILWGFKSPDCDLLPWSIGLGITTFLTIFSSLSLGLMISTFVKNETEANNTLPLILLPQIIFSGVLFQLEGLSSKISWLMISRWSVGAYGTLVNVNAMVPDAVSTPFGNAERPFEPTSIYDYTWGNLSLNWLILGLHSLIYLGLALWSLKRKDKVS